MHIIILIIGIGKDIINTFKGHLSAPLQIKNGTRKKFF